MSDDWKKGFHKALVDAIVRDGSPHDPNRNAYWGTSLPNNWEDILRWVRDEGIDYEATKPPVHAEWYEFQGTLYEGDTRVVGLDLLLVLNDGTECWYRYRYSMSDLILAVVQD
jgi:hypothetical protein